MRFVAGRGTVAESHREAFAGRGTVAERLQRGGAMAEHLLARGTVAENHREAFAGRGVVAELLAVSAMAKRMAAPWRRAIGKLLLARALQRSTIGKQPLPERRATAGKETRTTAGKERDCRREGIAGSNGLVSFFDAPLMQIIPIFVVW